MARFRRIWMATAAAVAMSAAAPFCLQAGQRSDLSHSWDFSAATETREIEVEVSASARSVLVSANVHVERGQVRFRLLDPTGAERVTGAVESGEGKWESGELPAVAGVWRALFELTEASGRMRVRSRVR